MKHLFLLSFILFLIAFTVIVEGRKCDFYSGKGDQTVENVCKETDYCFALWIIPENGTEEDKEFIKQGCWESSSTQNSCENEHSCIAQTTKKENPPFNVNFFCCCSSDFCNGNVTFLVVDDPEEAYMAEMKALEEDLAEALKSSSGKESFANSTSMGILVYFVFGIGIFVIIIMGIVFSWKQRRPLKKEALEEKLRMKMSENDEDLEAGVGLVDSKETDYESSFKIEESLLSREWEQIAKGKFAEVYSGVLQGEDVAFKVFGEDNREYFDNERFIYFKLAHLSGSTSNIIKYHGWQETNNSLVLVLKRIEPGNLRDFLIGAQENPFDLQTAFKIMRDITNGMSFLHGENKEEIVIAHRDLTSKNILIDANAKCYISDFGLSLITRGAKYSFAGRERQAEFCSLAEAGTMRYMAPELLEGAVNLKDCENALKQADVYALALVLWEVGNLCKALALNQTEYQMPFENMGKNTTIDHFCNLVATKRKRPGFSKWRDNQLSRSIRDTLTESWDSEPDARLTALCIVQRIVDLSHQFGGVSMEKLCESDKPLEKDDPDGWTNRNTCISRNLNIEDGSGDKIDCFVTSSEKHQIKAPKVTTAAPKLLFGANIICNNNNSESYGSVLSGETNQTELSSNSASSFVHHPMNFSVPQTPHPPLNIIQNFTSSRK